MISLAIFISVEIILMEKSGIILQKKRSNGLSSQKFKAFLIIGEYKNLYIFQSPKNVKCKVFSDNFYEQPWIISNDKLSNHSSTALHEVSWYILWLSWHIIIRNTITFLQYMTAVRLSWESEYVRNSDLYSWLHKQYNLRRINITV